MIDHLRISLLLMVIVASLIAFGCSSAVDTPAQPGLTTPTERTPSQDGRLIWGVYQLAFNPADGTVTVTPNRELEKHFNVTQFVKPPACYDCVKIVGSYYNPSAQEWTLGVLLKNPTIMAGYDVRGLVRNAGNKWLKNADGFMNNYYMQDMSFKAFNRTDPARVFWPLTTSQENYIFHFPPGSNWVMVDYIIDTSWPGNCQEPIIEDVSFQTLIENGHVDTPLTVRAFDHQGDFFVVQADLSPIGGSPNTPLFDDGQHGDGNTDDGIYGANDFLVNAPPGDYAFNIWAFDSGMNHGWNSWHVTLTGTANLDPIIDKITISRTTCLKNSSSEKVTVNCVAHDPNLDSLSYHWSSTMGTFDNSNSQTTQWKAPSTTGKYYLTCEVTDGKGGLAQGQSPKVRVTKYESMGAGPDFTCQRVIGSGSFKLSDYCPGKVVMLNFWATW